MEITYEETVEGLEHVRKDLFSIENGRLSKNIKLYRSLIRPVILVIYACFTWEFMADTRHLKL